MTFAATTNTEVLALAAIPNGELVATGGFSFANGVSANNIARWDGISWSPLGAGMTTATGQIVRAYAVAVLPNGDVIAGGRFDTAGGVLVNNIARWDGNSWSSLGTGANAAVLSLVTMPNGDLVAGGEFTTVDGTAANRIARWNGTSWSALGSGVGYPLGGGAQVYALAFTGGDLVAGGSFETAGDQVSSFAARLTTTCPANSVTFGAGCVGSNGLNTLVANTLPWVDATFRATGTGLPTTSVVLMLTSVTPVPQAVAPLTIFFPQAGVGCDVLVAPDILDVGVTLTGSLTSELFLPNTPPLVGVTFYHQLVPIEVDGLGAWIAVTATNALQLTAGMF